MKRESIRPMLHPDAPLVQCDCEAGRNECDECQGVGLVSWYTPGYGYQDDGCDACEGKGSTRCTTCDGEGSFPDPDALLECPFDGQWLHEDDGACLGGCGYVYTKTLSAEAILLRDLCAKALAARERREKEREAL